MPRTGIPAPSRTRPLRVTSAAVCEQHGKDESYHTPHAPDAVAFVHTTEEVAAIVSLCARYKTPVIAFGTGTSLAFAFGAILGLTLDTSGPPRPVTAPVTTYEPAAADEPANRSNSWA